MKYSHSQRRAGISALLCALLLGGGVWVQDLAADDDNSETGWIEIFSGKDLNGWTKKTGDWKIVGDVPLNPDNPKAFAPKPGTGVMVNGKGGRDTNIFTKKKHGDVQAHIEFTVPKGSNSGVYFQGRYEVQVFDSYGVKEAESSDCGGIYKRYNEKESYGFEGHAPRLNASLPPGEWQMFDVTFRAPRFDESGKKIEDAKFIKVVHNGKVIHENVTTTGPTRAAAFSDEKPLGPLMIQGDHGPVAYRNIRIKPIKLD
ncbi:hypothetical protein Mal52_20640 [Symmachiella dynata]|uniref:3-keto-alpha-glucoside-1,2-lyase/3-keto-2-hydroxy-glucal hydratase domain-containing protein n=1 Tax=Symmachiella dynata TaxID=2527995 RepID=A0A517ZM73_9PLAN|nr:DUF1080 domain-containing protein [Symmachiella dynata]QDU43588.1 hypothetical protein Mal52_20640 [Symmachiella dynata]